MYGSCLTTNDFGHQSAPTRTLWARMDHMSSSVDVHVIPLDSGWELRRRGQPSSTSRHGTRRSAIRMARAIADETGADVVVHDLDGTVAVLPSTI
jgi:hypothetical protein